MLTVSVDPMEIASLPVSVLVRNFGQELADRIKGGVSAPVTQVPTAAQWPVQQAPVQPAAAPPVLQGPAPGAPAPYFAAPDNRVFPPAQGQMSQMSAGLDLTTMAPMAVPQTPVGPPLPQPPAAVAVPTSAPVQAAAPAPPVTINYETVRGEMLRLFNDQAVPGGGQAAFYAVLSDCGMSSMQQMTPDNCGRVWQAISARRGGM